jgi:hypothetical protein
VRHNVTTHHSIELDLLSQNLLEKVGLTQTHLHTEVEVRTEVRPSGFRDSTLLLACQHNWVTRHSIELDLLSQNLLEKERVDAD